MSDLSAAFENAVTDWICGGAEPVRPTARYLALYTSAPSDAGGGVELSGNGYARQEIAFGPASSGLASNTGLLRFQSQGGDWGEITHGAIFDDPSAGAFLMWAALTAAKTIPDGDALEFQPGAVKVEAE